MMSITKSKLLDLCCGSGGVSLYALDVTNEMTQSLIDFDAKLTEYRTKKDDEEQIDPR